MTKEAFPQSLLFEHAEVGQPTGHDMPVRPASSNAKEVHELALRKQDGDLRNVRHPVEMAAIEPKTRKLTLLSRKLWMFLVSYSLSVDGTVTSVGILWRVQMATLQKDVQFDSNDTAHLKESIRQCQKTLVEWAASARDKTTGETRSWTSTQLLGSVEFVVDQYGRKCLEWNFPPALLRQMLAHKHWFESSLQVANMLSRHSSLALFQVVSRYKTSPSGLTERRPWREWIPVLTGESAESAEMTARLRDAKKGGAADADSAKGAKYKEWRYFNRDVIAPAVTELNQVLEDVWVEAVPIKVAGKNEFLQFKVTPRDGFKRKRAYGSDIPQECKHAVEVMTGLGLVQNLAIQLCKEHTPELMLQVATVVSHRASDTRRSPVGNVQGLFITVMKEKVAERDAVATKAIEVAQQRPVSADKMADESLEDFQANLTEKVRREWETMPVEVKDDYKQRFRDEELPNAPSVVKNAHTKSGIELPIVRARFFNWLAKDRAGDDWTPSDRTLLAFERSRRSTRPGG
jgi:hypothetical protein